MEMQNGTWSPKLYRSNYTVAARENGTTRPGVLEGHGAATGHFGHSICHDVGQAPVLSITVSTKLKIQAVNKNADAISVNPKMTLLSTQ